MTTFHTGDPASATGGFARPRRLVGALTVIYAYAFADRVILALLVDPMRADLHITDVQVSLLLGIAFAAIYCVANLPAGYLVDRFNRRALIAFASVAWSGMTIATALAPNFADLLAARAGVGLAEAVVGPAAFSLIRDSIAERSRGVAFSVYAMAPLVGGGLALAAGGLLLRAAQAGWFDAVPLLHGRAPWRVVLLALGFAGLPLGLLLLLFPEPARRLPLAGERAGLAAALAHVRANARGYVVLAGFATFAAMMAFGQSAWLPAMLSRRWAVPPARLGPMLGAVTLCSGLAGLSLSGYVVHRMTTRGQDILIFGALAAFGTALGLAGAAVAPSFALSLGCAAVGLFFVGLSYPVGATVLAGRTPSPLMGTIAASYLLLQTLLGQALGPTLIALAAAHLVAGPGSLPGAFALTMAGFGGGATASAWILHRHGGWAGLPAARTMDQNGNRR